MRRCVRDEILLIGNDLSDDQLAERVVFDRLSSRDSRQQKMGHIPHLIDVNFVVLFFVRKFLNILEQVVVIEQLLELILVDFHITSAHTHNFTSFELRQFTTDVSASKTTGAGE